MAETKTILVVDDEAEFREACRATFAAKYYEVVLTSSASEARERMRGNPDIVVLGTVAPVGEAFRFQEWMKGQPRYRDIPLIVIDARPEDRAQKGWTRAEGLRLRSDDYLTKPAEPSALVPRIQRILAQAAARIKVLVADDHTMIRDGICAVLALQKDVDVVAEAVNGQEAIDKVLRLSPNVVLMDISMPVLNGLEATKRISQECPQTKVLILTQYDDEENMLVAGRVGASGFIAKRAAGSELVNGIRSVHRGQFFPSTFSEFVLN